MTFWEFASQQPLAACVLGFFAMLATFGAFVGMATAAAAFASTKEGK